jgi:two-component system sensor histidine kinase AlgZ
MTSTARRWAWNVVAGIAMGAFPALIEVTFGHTGFSRFLRSALIGSLYALCISIPCWIVLPWAYGRMADRSLRLKVGMCGVLFGVFCFAGCLLASLILLALGVIEREAFWAVFRSDLRVSALITFTFGVLTMVIANLVTRLTTAEEELRRRQIEEERHSKMVAEARYASLESRVHPHFLFNTLNSISALVRENPAEAELMIERLSALLRYSLDSNVAGLVPLRDELRIVEEYLAIEQVRFGARLRFRIDAEEAAASQLVPALSVQTLVENSVKYAVGSRREGAQIVVVARVESGALRVAVTDDGPGFEPGTMVKPGHGLDLLKRRLEAMFGAAGSLETAVENGFTSVVIRVGAA